MRDVKFIISLLISLFCLAGGLFAQQVITNSKGEKIVVFPDGSWRHFQPADSVLIRGSMQTDRPFTRTANPDQDFEKSADPTLDRSSEARVAIEFANQLKSDASAARLVLVDATNQKFNIEAKLNQARENKTLIDPDILAKLEEEYARATEEVKNAKQYHQKISNFAGKALAVSNMAGEKRQKRLARLMAQHTAFTSSTEWKPSDDRGYGERKETGIADLSWQELQTPEPQPEANPPELPVPEVKGSRVLQPVPAEPGMKWNVPGQEPYRRVPVNCQVTVQELDEATGQKRLLLDETRLFTHTDEELRPYFRDESLVDCRAFISSISGYRYLTVKFIIASPNARQNFGILQEQALLRFRLLDGTFVNFYNIQADRGKIDRYSGNTIFTGHYALGSSTEKQLLKSELDKMRVVWSSGFEDYEIHDIDFFINQLNCLNNYRIE